MAYDQLLAERVRDVLEGRPGLEEQRMFGGLAFLIDRRMCCGVMRNGLLLRLGVEGVAVALANHPHTRSMDFTGKVMRNSVLVEAPGVQTGAQLPAGWTRAHGRDGRPDALTVMTARAGAGR